MKHTVLKTVVACAFMAAANFEGIRGIVDLQEASELQMSVSYSLREGLLSQTGCGVLEKKTHIYFLA